MGKSMKIIHKWWIVQPATFDYGRVSHGFLNIVHVVVEHDDHDGIDL